MVEEGPTHTEVAGTKSTEKTGETQQPKHEAGPIPEATPKAQSAKFSQRLSRRPKGIHRKPPSLQSSLSATPLIFPPLLPPTSDLLPYLPSTLILPARVSSTGLAHTVTLNVRSNTLLLRINTTYEAILPLPIPARFMTTRKGTITITRFPKQPLHIRPAAGATGLLVGALRPVVPPVIAISRRLSNRVFLALLGRRKVAVKLFPLDEIPEYAIACRAVLQRARGPGVVPLLAGVQGRGYCGLVMPVLNNLARYVNRFGKLGAEGRGVVALVVRGVCRVHQIGGVVGGFDKEHVLVDCHGAMISRVACARVVHGDTGSAGGENVTRCSSSSQDVSWTDTVESVARLVRECCELSEGSEEFLEGCERGWSAQEMAAHSWVREAPIPKLRRMRVRGCKDVGEVPRRIGSGTLQGILGWEFVHR